MGGSSSSGRREGGEAAAGDSGGSRDSRGSKGDAVGRLMAARVVVMVAREVAAVEGMVWGKRGTSTHSLFRIRNFPAWYSLSKSSFDMESLASWIFSMNTAAAD